MISKANLKAQIAAIFLLFTFFLVVLFSSCDDSPKGKFIYPSEPIRDMKIADSLYTLALAVQKGESNYNAALLFRNKYGWLLNKVEQLKKDIPEILSSEKYSPVFEYQKIFNPQDAPNEYWNQFYEIASALKIYFKKGTPEYRENLALLTYLEMLLNKNDDLLSDLPELLQYSFMESQADYFTMLWQYAMSQARSGRELDAIYTLEKGFQNLENGSLKSNYSLALFQLYSLNKMYDKIILNEAYINADTTASFQFYLGEAYLNKQNDALALVCFDIYSTKLQINEHSGEVFTKSGNSVIQVRPEHLEVMDDFYNGRDAEKSCKFYKMGIDMLSKKRDDSLANDQLNAIKDPDEKKLMTAQFEKYKKEQKDLLARLTQKTKICR